MSTHKQITKANHNLLKHK